jgi:cellulose synthase (UDP-forming)
MLDDLAAAAGTTAGASIQARFLPGHKAIDLPLRIVKIEDSDIMAEFRPRNLLEEGGIAELVFGRADAWVGWDRHEQDRPFVSLGRVALSIGGVFAGNSQFRRRRIAPAAPAAGVPPIPPAPPVAPPKGVPAGALLRPRRLAATTATAAGALLVFGATALAQPAGVPLGTVAPPVTGGPAAPQTTAPGEVREIARTLRQLGVPGPMQLRGVTDLQGVVFGLRGDEVVLSAELELTGSWSPALIPSQSQLRITLNEEVVGTLNPDPALPNFGPISLPVASLFFSETNRLNFRFAGRYTQECNDPLSGLLWLTISDRSVLRMRVARLTLPPDLSRLPEPFYDPRELREPLSLPVVFRTPSPSASLVRAAIISSSWFAVQADFRGARFPVRRSMPATGHAMMVAASPEGVPELGIPAFEGPTLAVRPNPSDPFGQILVVGGRNPAETIVAAQAMAVGARGFAGDTVRVGQVTIVPRRPYDAPRWVPRDRPVRFGELVDPAELQGSGFVPAPITVPLRTSPDLYLAPGQTLDARVRFVGPPSPIADLRVSRMDSFLSDLYLKSTPMASGELPWPVAPVARWAGFGAEVIQEARIGLPPGFISGQNALRFAFDMRPFNRGDCVAIPQDLRVSVLPDSTVDLSRAHRFALMPNLAFFATAGFPFTRLADFSETALVLPSEATDEELTVALDLVGRMAGFVGHPALAIEVVTGGNLAQVSERDLLLIGAAARQPALATLLADAPFRLEQGRVTLSVPPVSQHVREIFVRAPRQVERDRATTLLSTSPDGLGILFSFESPLSPSRVVVIATAATPEAMRQLENAIFDPEASARIQGDLVVVNGGRVDSFRVGPVFERGELPLWERPRFWFGDRPEFLFLILLAGGFTVVFPAYAFLRRRAATRLEVK